MFNAVLISKPNHTGFVVIHDLLNSDVKGHNLRSGHGGVYFIKAHIATAFIENRTATAFPVGSPLSLCLSAAHSTVSNTVMCSWFVQAGLLIEYQVLNIPCSGSERVRSEFYIVVGIR